MNSQKDHVLLEAVIFRAFKDQGQLERSSFLSSAPGLPALCCHKALLNIAVPLQVRTGSACWHDTFHTASLSISSSK